MAINDAFDAIRFFTALDPYFYTVDNRPLSDLETNQNILAEAGDAGYSASKAVALAAGFTMRGYSRENYGVGLLTFPSNLTFVIERAILNQSLPVSGTDSREVPHLGIQVDSAIIGPFSAATNPGEERPFLVQARKIDADNTTPFYDGTNTFSTDAYIIGNIEYQILIGADVAIGSGLFNMPSPTPGWVPVFQVVLIHGSSTVDAPDVYYGTADARFYDEGAVFGSGSGLSFELNVDTRIATANQQTFSALAIDANFAFVFVDGLFQSGITVVNSTTIDLPEPAPLGTVVDFVTTAGGSYTAGTIKRDRRIATANQQLFTGLQVNAFFASVYVQGIYQDNFIIVDSQTIQLADPLPTGTRVVFEEKSAGIADLGVVVPPGGNSGDVLTKDSLSDYDFSWQPSLGSSPVPDGGDIGQVLTKNSSGDQDLLWADPAGGVGPGAPFSVETQIAASSQSVFVVSTDPTTMLVFRNGQHITEDVTPVLPNQIVISPAASLGEELVFVQTGGGSLDAVTIQKENDLQLILNSRECSIPPDTAINDIEVLANDVLLAGSVVSSELWRSIDGGQTWASVTPGNLPDGVYGLAYNGSRIVAVGDGGDSSYSDNNGTSWVANTAVSGVTAFTAATWDDDNSLFIAVGDGGRLATSADGATWTPQTLDGGVINFKSVHSYGGLSVAVGTSGSSENVFVSSDGTTWSAATTASLTGGFEKVYYGGSRWFAAGENEIASSIDGLSWGNATAISEAGTGAVYVDGVYLVFAQNGKVWASTDSAVTWTSYRIGGNVPSNYIKAVSISGSNICMLGSYQMTRYVSKIIRGI